MKIGTIELPETITLHETGRVAQLCFYLANGRWKSMYVHYSNDGKFDKFENDMFDFPHISACARSLKQALKVHGYE